MTAGGLWNSTGPPSGWCGAALNRLDAWRIEPVLGEGRDAVHNRLAEAFATRERWVIHPAMMALWREHCTPGQHLCLIGLVARNSPELGDVEMSVESPTVVWGSKGPVSLSPGRNRLARFGAPEPPDAIVVDPWCLSFGMYPQASWAANPPTDEVTFRRFTAEIATSLKAIALLSTVPDIASWCRSATAVVVPLKNDKPGLFKSASSEDVMGMVMVDGSAGLLRAVEGLIHETAHLHLYMLEATTPLVRAGHDVLYRSPLRSDPRPLRGVLLAFHALAYIAASFRELAVRLGLDELVPPRELLDALEIARESARLGEPGLTDEGSRFVQSTEEVVSYAFRLTTA